MQRTKKRRDLKIILILLLGVSISVASFFYLNHVQIKNNKALVELAIQDTKKKINRELKKITLSINSLHLLFQTQDSIHRDLFTKFTEPFIGILPGVRALEWAPKILHRDRSSFVKKIRSEGFENFDILSPDPILKKFGSSSKKTYYYPLQFIAPKKLENFVIGFDIAADSSRSSCINKSFSSNKIALSPPLSLVQDRDSSKSFFIVQSVKKNNLEKGAILGVFNVQYFIENILQTELTVLDIRVYDKTSNDQPMYSNAKKQAFTIEDLSQTNFQGNSFEATLGNRIWSIYYTPNEKMATYPHLAISYACLFFGLLITLLLILMIYNNSNAKIGLEEKVENRTQELNDANKQQAILLKEIHHRVKNNLQVITSLLSLQSGNIEDPKVKEIFTVSQYRINAMAVLHEELYQSENLSKIGYGNYLSKLVDYLILSIKGKNNNILLDIQVPDSLQLNIDTAIPLGLLINEIITNSLKYGFPNQETQKIYIKINVKEPPNFELYIGDNGKGFSDDINYKTTKSLGLKLIRQLSRQLNGSFEKTKEQKGTHYYIQFQEID